MRSLWDICTAVIQAKNLYPPVVANEEALGFFLKFVADASSSQVFQDVSRPAYACKPCFVKLERGNRHYSATVSLINELRKLLLAIINNLTRRLWK